MKRLILAIISVIALTGCYLFEPEKTTVIVCGKPCLVSISSTNTINANLIKQIRPSSRIGKDGPVREVEINFIDNKSSWFPASDPQKEINRITSLIQNACK